MIALLLFAVLPIGPAEHHVDLIERNAVHCAETGRFNFEQWVFWVWDADEGKHRCIGFKLVKTERLRRRRDEWILPTEEGLIVAPHRNATATLYDPELVDREMWPKERRREVFR